MASRKIENLLNELLELTELERNLTSEYMQNVNVLQAEIKRVTEELALSVIYEPRRC